MSKIRGGHTLAVVGVLLAAACLAACSSSRSKAARDTRERAYRANNVGVALLEQLKYPEAATAFRSALSIDPTLALGHFNLAVSLLYQQDLDGAAREATDAAQKMPGQPQPPYVLGLIARAQNRSDAARGYFEQVRRLDPSDVGASVNLAQVDLEERRYDEAVSVLRPVVAAEPYHITAAYVLGLALTRSGVTDEGQQLLERAQTLRRVNYAVTFGTGYLEQGRYAEAMASTGAEPELVDQQTPSASFSGSRIGSSQPAQAGAPSPFGRTFPAAQLTDAGVRDIAAGLGGGAALVDIDGDGDLDLVIVSAAGQRLLRHDPGDQWTDATAGSGLEAVPQDAVAIGVVSADFDNDGAADLFVLRSGQSSLYRNDGKGHFTDVTRTAGIPPFAAVPGAAAFVDVDHDGDVDLVIAGLVDVATTKTTAAGSSVAFPGGFAPAPLELLRNNGNGTFTDITRDARLDSRGHVIAIVPTDYDNHRDIDLLVVNADGPPQLFSNQRDGTFRDVAAEAGLSTVARAGEAVSAVATGDLNKDDWPDFVFGRADGAVVAMSDGRGHFTVSPLPSSIAAPTAVQLVDYDNDGLLDILASGANGPKLLRNLGRSWSDVSASALTQVVSTATGGVRAFAAGDIDADGDTDIVVAAGGAVTLWRNSGDPRNKSLRVQLRGRVTNRLGVGSKVQVRAGSLSGRFETSAAWPAVAPSDIVFGVGTRPGAEVVRILWPSGILQAETASASADTGATSVLPSPFVVEELDRKPSSCPFLFVWNGERFEFVTDFLGGGEMGDWEGPGAYDHPDPVEYVRIRGDQLKPDGDRLSIRITNELEEVLYLDRVQLLALAHPSDVQVFPNEGMTDPPKPFRLHAVRSAHSPARVVDDHGHDVTDRIAALDRRYPDDFALSRIRGYADMHSLTIDIGAGSTARTLLLTGWTDYAFSSDNVAALQAGRSSAEPVLEARQTDGRWRKLPLEIGIPVGRPQTIPLDLGHVLKSGEHELRLSTNMRIYWDQILVGDTVSADTVRAATLEPQSATLRARGFSAEVRPDGKEPPVYDYSRISPASPWKLFTGSYTREGDVLGLLTSSDDRYVIGKPGDEIALEFAATALAPLPQGWTRTFLLKGDGFSKEMDPNSASPYSVEPLPFHAMTKYPFPATEHYPETPEYDRYRSEYNTRVVTRPVAPLYAGPREPNR